MILLAVVFLAAAAYAHYRIPRHTSGTAKIMVSHVVLGAVGVAFGYVSATTLSYENVPVVLIFLVGFGLVHVPAAIILFIKRERGTGKS